MKPLKARDFLFRVEDRAAGLLDGALPPERRVMWTILQYHFGDPWLHYELQPQVSRRIVEVGLHFEGPAEQSERGALLLAAHAAPLLAELGDGWELEEWTVSWRRLHRTIAFETLTPDLAEETAASFARLIGATAPVLRATGLADEPRVATAEPTGRGRGRRPRKRRASG